MSKLVGLSGSLVLLLSLSGWSPPLAPAVDEPVFGEWHRLNTRNSGGNPASSEHEVMHFWAETAGWVGRYEKRAEATLGFRNPPDGTVGIFAGAVATKFVCQPAFPFYPCQDVVQVVEGTTRYSPPREAAVRGTPAAHRRANGRGSRGHVAILSQALELRLSVVPGFR